MAASAYLKLSGEAQGTVNGGVTLAGREGSMEVYGWSHEVIAPRDAASGLPTGKRQHKPIVITKPIDRATPLLMNILTNHENITQWRLDCWRTSGRAGKEEQYYTIELLNASIAGIRQEQLNNTYEENQPLAVREHVSFTYQRIVWTWQDGGITTEDDWETAVV